MSIQVSISASDLRGSINTVQDSSKWKKFYCDKKCHLYKIFENKLYILALGARLDERVLAIRLSIVQKRVDDERFRALISRIVGRRWLARVGQVDWWRCFVVRRVVVAVHGRLVLVQVVLLARLMLVRAC